MKRLVPAFGIPLILAVGLGQGDAGLPTALPATLDHGLRFSLDSLPGTLAQSLTPHAPVPNPRVTRRPNLTLPYVQVPHGPGDVMPRSYLIFGLRTGPGGMACTDRNGAVIPMPFNPQIHMKPFTTSPTFPQILPPTFILPQPIPKK